MNLDPSREELWRRIEEADDSACDGWSNHDCSHCRLVVEALRGGSVHCPDCNHINALGHSCADWKAYDAREIDLDEVTRRWNERLTERFAGNRHG
jgi:hypothetical protein